MAKDLLSHIKDMGAPLKVRTEKNSEGPVIYLALCISDLQDDSFISS